MIASKYFILLLIEFHSIICRTEIVKYKTETVKHIMPRRAKRNQRKKRNPKRNHKKQAAPKASRAVQSNTEPVFGECEFSEIPRESWGNRERALIDTTLRKAKLVTERTLKSPISFNFEHCRMAVFCNKKAKRSYYMAFWDQQKVSQNNQYTGGTVWLFGLEDSEIPMLCDWWPEGKAVLTKGRVMMYGDEPLQVYHRHLSMHLIRIPWLCPQ